MKNLIEEKVRSLINLLKKSDKILPITVQIKDKITGKHVKTMTLMVQGGKYDTTNNKLILSIYQNHSIGEVAREPTEQVFDLEEILDLNTVIGFIKENWD
ncbi:MAG: hypothetical protein WC575_00040 [Patescibacteria group bacterium]